MVLKILKEMLQSLLISKFINIFQLLYSIFSKCASNKLLKLKAVSDTRTPKYLI